MGRRVWENALNWTCAFMYLDIISTTFRSLQDNFLPEKEWHLLVNKRWLHESDGILQKKEAPVLKLEGSHTENWGGKNLFEVLHMNPALSYCFPAPARSLLPQKFISFWAYSGQGEFGFIVSLANGEIHNFILCNLMGIERFQKYSRHSFNSLFYLLNKLISHSREMFPFGSK